MWEELGLDITSLARRPSRGESVAAAFRQLLRAYGADDEVAVWMATSAFCMSLRLQLRDLLSREIDWEPKGRWLDGFAKNRILFERPRRVRVAQAVVWGLRADVGGPQWASPFDAAIELTPEMSDLYSYTVRFGDRRGFPGEDLQGSLSRIAADIEGGVVEWEFTWSEEGAGELCRAADV